MNTASLFKMILNNDLFRCDGVVSKGARNSQILRRIVREVSGLPATETVTLLDISVKNINKLPGRMFQNINLDLSGLVISTGTLQNIDKKVYDIVLTLFSSRYRKILF